MEEHFFKVKSAVAVGPILAAKIAGKLRKEPVLWLVSGGSSIDVAVVCANKLRDKDLSGLTVSLADERYGPPGHADSNWRQLLDKGFLAAGAQLRPYLDGKSFDETLLELNAFLESAFKSPGYKIASLGMGQDGHTAGILPGSSAATSNDLLAGYQAEDYRRLTISLKGIQRLDEAVLYAVGASKSSQLETLAERNVDPMQQPAQIIKALPRWSVYNDRIGEEI